LICGVASARGEKHSNKRKNMPRGINDFLSEIICGYILVQK